MKTKLDRKTKKTILTAQKNELTEHFIYKKLSQSIKNHHNKKVLKRISDDELKHHDFWREYTNEDVKPNKLKIWWYFLISRIFGITFGIKLMEKGEKRTEMAYEKIAKKLPSAKKIVKDENEHEKILIDLIDEERLKYVGSMVLGLNDALVELTGALAGFTFVLNNSSLIATTGLITGIAASLSMGTSEYLSTKSEGDKDPVKASIYTGVAYVITVLFLIFPFLFFKDVYFSLGVTVLNAVIIIFVFTFYISIAKDLSFKKRFIEMVLISLSITALTFFIGFIVRIFFNIEI